MIVSNWKLTLDPSGTPVVLVAVGQRMEAEIDPACDLPLEVVPLVDSLYPFLRLSGNAVISFTLRTYDTTAATDAAARTALLDGLVAAQTMVRKPLRIEAAGVTSHYWQFASAAVSRYVPRRHLPNPAAARSTEWSITATGLAKHAVTPP